MTMNPNDDTHPGMVGPYQAAMRLDVTLAQILRMYKHGTLRGYQTAKYGLLIEAASVERFRVNRIKAGLARRRDGGPLPRVAKSSTTTADHLRRKG